VKADRSILKLMERVGPLHVLNAVLEEVNQIKNKDELTELGVNVIEPLWEDYEEAAKMIGTTSLQDNLCCLTARRNGFVCVTNDRSLRKLCKEKGVKVCWGLELLKRLYKAGGIYAERLKELVELIQQNNPRHISIELVERFKQELQ